MSRSNNSGYLLSKLSNYFKGTSLSNKSNWEFLFLLGILIYAIIAYLDSTNYHDEAKLFPQYVIISLIILIAIRFIVTKFLSDYDFSLGSFAADEELQEKQEQVGDQMSKSSGAIPLLFILIFAISVWVFGFLISSGAFILVFSYYESKDVKLSIISTVCGMIIVYGLFVFLLNIRLWEGLIF